MGYKAKSARAEMKLNSSSSCRFFWSLLQLLFRQRSRRQEQQISAMGLTHVWFFQLIFEKEGVYLHTNAKKMLQDTTLPGFIRVVERVS